MDWSWYVQNLCHQNSTWIFVYDYPSTRLQSQETVVRFEAEVGTKTVSNILLFLSRSSLSSPPPPVSTFFSEDIDAHLNSRDRTRIEFMKLVRVFFGHLWRRSESGGRMADASQMQRKATIHLCTNSYLESVSSSTLLSMPAIELCQQSWGGRGAKLDLRNMLLYHLGWAWHEEESSFQAFSSPGEI